MLNHFIWDSVYNGGGVAIGDLNNDGLQDIVLTSNFEGDAIYLNKGKMRFEDISAASGIQVHSDRVSSGVSLIDINKDGFLDIYVCKFGYTERPEDRKNLLFINNGDLTFTESARQYGVDNGGYTVQASFFDYNKDGFIDLYVMNQPSNARHVRGKYISGDNDTQYITPYTSDRLYRNNGNNTFTDVSEEAGIVNFAYGLGVVIADLTNDGWPDIYIANDYIKPDNYFVNNGDGTFTDQIQSRFNHISNFSMGADIADVNNDGYMDVATLDMAGANHYRSKTNMPSMSPKAFWSTVEKGFHHQYMHNTLQLNNGNGFFSDVGYFAGIAKTDWSWSILLADFNNDGLDDMFVTNGIKKDVRNNDFIDQMKVLIDEKKLTKDIMPALDIIPSNPMPNYMFNNVDGIQFNNVAEEWGLAKPGFSNGAAYGDLDNDGDLDLVVNNISDAASVYRNNSTKNYLRIRLLSSKTNRPVLNSRVTITVDGREMTKELLHARGYISMPENIIHFGLGEALAVDKVKVVWPDLGVYYIEDVKANQELVIDQDNIRKTEKFRPSVVNAKYFAQQPSNAGFQFSHRENSFDDFAKQVLLPFKQSEFGPLMSKADVNGDGRDDVYVGGASGQAGEIFKSNADGTFAKLSNPVFSGDATREDLGSLFFDADNDGDQDLYVVSGGYEFPDGSPNYFDRLYLNNGSGRFSKAMDVPGSNFSGLAVCGSDVDGDGDTDIFVGGRVVPGAYPQSPGGRLFMNDSGKLVDKTDDLAPAFKSLGLITDAVFSDFDRDGDDDLLLVGEWMPLTRFDNQGGRFGDPVTVEDSHGIWFHINAVDLDGDGDDDYIAGNIGPNNKFKASPDKPFWLYAGDFDENGNYDIVLAGYSEDQLVPVRGRECSSEQLPFIKDKFPTYDEFARASLSDIYDLNRAQALKATTLYNGIFWNNDQALDFKKLPTEAQFAPINASVAFDVNRDGYLDIVAVGNLFSTEVETTRYDAGIGLVLLSDGTGEYKAVKPGESGFFAHKNAKSLVMLGDDSPLFVVANNNDAVQVFRFIGS